MSKQLKTFILYSGLVLAFAAISWLNNGNKINILYILWGISPTIASSVNFFL